MSVHFTIEVDYDDSLREDIGGAARGFAGIVIEQEGVTRVKVYVEGGLVAEEWLEDYDASSIEADPMRAQRKGF